MPIRIAPAAVIFICMSSLGGERKIATMLFADLVGSTELATELDPEDLRGRLEPFFDAARTGWLLGGAEREEAKRTFEGLGATLPVN